jgi:tetratricopeptide (TPR) repeat protein
LTTTALLLAVFAALGIALWQANVARQQAHVAREQAERADTIRQFLVGVFDQAEPDANLGKPITAQQLLEQGEQQLAAGADLQTGTRLDLTVLIGHLYWDLGDYAHAEPLLKKAAASAADANVPDEVRARTLMMIAKTESEKRKFAEAMDHAKQAITIAHRAGQPGVDTASESRRILAASLQGQDNSKAAEPILREALAEDRALYGDRHHAVVDDWISLGGVLTELSRFDEATIALQNAVDLARLVHGPIHSSVANALQELSGTASYAGDYAKSERLIREALDIFEKVFGPEHNETMIARGNLLWAIERQGRYEEALQGRLQMMSALQKLSTTRPETIAAAYTALGNDHFELGRLEEAEAALRQALATWTKLQGSNDEWDSADPLVVLADILLAQGRYSEAEATVRQAIAIEQKHEPPSSGWLNRDRSTLGVILRRQHRNEEALRETSAAMEARRGAKPDPIQCGLLSRLSLAQLDAGDVAAAHATALESVALARSVLPRRHLGLSGPLYALARADLAQGRAAEAEPMLREALTLVSPPYPPSDLRVIEIQTALVDALEALGRNDDAGKLRAEIEPALRASRSPYASELLSHVTKSATNR